VRTHLYADARRKTYSHQSWDCNSSASRKSAENNNYCIRVVAVVAIGVGIGVVAIRVVAVVAIGVGIGVVPICIGASYLQANA